MQASRASSRAIRQLAASQQTRSLHMTGPAKTSSLLTSERSAKDPKRIMSMSPSVGDSFYVNLHNLHDYDPDAKIAPIQVPILPHSMPAIRAAEAEPAVMRAEIYTVAGNSTHIHAPSAMADVADNGAIDFQGLAAQVANKLSKPVEETVSMTRQLWNGLVDDVLGPKGSGASRA